MDTAPSQPELTMDAPAVFHAPPGSPCGGMGGHHSARADKDEWLTPPEILRALGDFDLDPCSPVNRPWPTASRHLTWQDNGLLAEWNGRVWCNPPYGREAGRWLARCAEHGNATALIFARTETADWQAHVWAKADAILFLFGRLNFHHVDGRRAAANSGAPSALISYNAENTRFLENSQLPGRLIRLANVQTVATEGAAASPAEAAQPSSQD